MCRLGEDTGGVGVDEAESVGRAGGYVGLGLELIGAGGGVDVLFQDLGDWWVDGVVGEEEVGFLCVTAGEDVLVLQILGGYRGEVLT